MDFSQDGRLLITSSDDDSIKIYDAVEAGEPRTLFSKKYGASLIRFTHAGTTVLHGSTKVGFLFYFLPSSCFAAGDVLLELVATNDSATNLTSHSLL